MHIPPYHKKESWQRIFIGAFFGGIISYCIILFMYGSMYEQLYKQNFALEARVKELKSQNEALLQAKKDSEEKTKDSMRVDKIEVTILNVKKLQLDRLIVHQLEEMIKQEVNHIIGQDVKILSESTNLLISTIENKAFSIDDFTYYFKVNQLVVSQTVKLKMEVIISR